MTSGILVVDDERGARDPLAAALQMVGYSVRTASSGETALRMISKSVPRAVPRLREALEHLGVRPIYGEDSPG